LGRAYWYAVAPFHRLLFPKMLQGIAEAVPTPTRAAERTHR